MFTNSILAPRVKKLGSRDSEKIKQSLRDADYYVQFPTPIENLLNQHLSDEYSNIIICIAANW